MWCYMLLLLLLTIVTKLATSLCKLTDMTLLQMSWPVVLRGGLAEDDPLEGLPELWAEHRVNDGVQGGVEIAEPKEEGHEVAVKGKVLK